MVYIPISNYSLASSWNGSQVHSKQLLHSQLKSYTKPMEEPISKSTKLWKTMEFLKRIHVCMIRGSTWSNKNQIWEEVSIANLEKLYTRRRVWRREKAQLKSPKNNTLLKLERWGEGWWNLFFTLSLVSLTCKRREKTRRRRSLLWFRCSREMKMKKKVKGANVGSYINGQVVGPIGP